MRSRLLTIVTVVVGLTPFVAAQQPQAPQGDRGVQVGVPNGRGGQPAAAARRGGPPPGPVPRAADGHAMLGGATPKVKGVWLPGNGGAQTMVADIKTVPFQPWAQALYAERGPNQLEPHTRCKPSGFVRQFLTPYGVEIVEMPDIQRVYIFDIGGPHTYRTIYMDRRTHPQKLEPSFYGDSIGRWEGDTLVVETTGFNDSFWMDRRGLPHTEQLKTVERFTRTDSLTIKYEVSVDDPGAYTRPWTSNFLLRWENGTELFEYVCQEANYAGTLMLGKEKSIDRTSNIVP
jgi:hypothetical protein